MHSPLLMVTKFLHHLVFKMLHSLAHPRVKTTQELIIQYFVWRGYKKDITAWVRSCTACQLAKVHHHTIVPLHKFTLPDSSLDCIHVDIVGPLPQLCGHSYLFTIINMVTCWPINHRWAFFFSQNDLPCQSYDVFRSFRT